VETEKINKLQIFGLFFSIRDSYQIDPAASIQEQKYAVHPTVFNQF